MTRLALRISFAGGRESAVRLAVTAVGVALGVGLLLVTLAGVNALHAQDRRTAWLGTSAHNVRPSVDEATTDPLWGSVTLDQFGSREIERVDVAATGPRAPVPPGIPRLPRPGEYYASPALARLLRTTPADQFADRYPGHLVGTIGDAALASPRSLTVVVGRTVAQLAHTPGAAEVRSIETTPQGSSPFDPHPGRIELILAVVAGALLFPVFVFIATATRLAAAQREQRFAAMRLVGATPGQVSVVSAVEAVVASSIGVAAGFVLFAVLRAPMARVPFTGVPFFPADLTISAADALLVAVGIPVVAAAVAMVALRRVDVSPLGVHRHAPAPPPRAWRLVPLAAGVGELAYFVGVGKPSTTGRQIEAYGVGFLLAMVGLLVAGPWLTMAGSRLVATRAKRPAALIAGRRLADSPRAAFRSVSGLIIALFITTTALGVITTVVGYHATSTGGAAGRRLVVEDFVSQPLAALPQGLVNRLDTTGGVRGVVAVHTDGTAPSLPTPGAGSGGPAVGPVGGGPVGGGPDVGPVGGVRTMGPGNATGQVAPVLAPSGLVLCTDLSEVPVLGHCEPGATVAAFPWIDGGSFTKGRSPLGEANLRPTVPVSAAALHALPVRSLYVDTDGSTAAIERVRTALETALPKSPDTIGPPSTLSEISPRSQEQLAGYERLAEVAIIASLPIAACSLAVSVATGITDRRRPFSLLRLAGTPVRVLRRVVALEAALPLVAVSALSAGTGLLAADLFLRAQLSESLRPQGAAYYAAVGGALLAALGIIGATLPLLERMTGPEVARNE